MMTNKNLFVILAIVVLPTMVLANDYIVGDYTGWTTGFDYKAWAKGKEFFVGDRLIFKYPVGYHNVFKVNGTAFQTCVKPPPSEALTSGYDIITLTTPGRKWYICGVAMHCAMGGQKLFIEVSQYGVVTPGAAPYPAKEKIPAPVQDISPSLGPSPSIVFGSDYIVGDYAGWTTGFDYQAWTKGKKFFVGDRLIFRYPVGQHNVFKVNGTTFQNCEKPPLSEALTSGYDVIILATPGRKWYICGVAMHCAMGGQKLFIEVSEYGVLTPGAAPYPAKEKITTPDEDIYAPSPSMVYGKDYIVGDYMGWTTGFDYQAWAMGKKFYVGDRLIFKYPVGHHNVFKVNGTAFQTCAKPPPSEALTSGYDVITLATQGRKWYICGVTMHCAMGGQKLFIEVSEYGVLTPGAAP